MAQKLRIVILESGLELVPEQIRRHPQVVRTAKRYGLKPGEMILDKSLHYNAMFELPQKWKRGRPDILHVSLLNILDSPLAEEGLVEVYFQSFDGRIFQVDHTTRLPKNYERFKGLMAQLLREGRVPPRGDPLIWEVARGLGEFLSDGKGLILLWERGRDARLEWVVARSIYSGMMLGLGGFPRGDFKKSTLRKAREAYKVMGGRPLKAWTLAGRIVWVGEWILGVG